MLFKSSRHNQKGHEESCNIETGILREIKL